MTSPPSGQADGSLDAPLERTPPGDRVARRRPASRPEAPGPLRRLFRVGDEYPNRAVPWLLAYMAVFLIRPAETLFPSLQAVPFERIVAIVLLARVLLGNELRWKPRLPLVAMILFVAVLGLATLFAMDPTLAWQQYEKTLKIAVFALCASLVLNSRADLVMFASGWIAIMAAYQVKALQEYFLHGRGVYRMGFWRLIGIEDTNGDPNTFAAKSLLLLPFIVAMLQLTSQRRNRLLLLAAVGLVVTVIVLTGSRSALVVGVFYAVVLLLTSGRRFATGLVLVAVFAVGAALLPAAIALRYRSIVDPTVNRSAEESAQGRISGLKRGLHLFLQRPVLGIGPNCTVISHREYDKYMPETFGFQTHSLLGQLAGETGSFGIAAMTLLCASIAATSRRLKATFRGADDGPDRIPVVLAAACTTQVLLCIASGAFGHNAYEYNWLWLAALASACGALATAPVFADGWTRGRRVPVQAQRPADGPAAREAGVTRPRGPAAEPSE
ncbi:MAG: O-antigen ligase family protein [Acidobacteria bacterium]|jgi:O-antigen ligase|nr:O-antigen ligase family protein [Acidobacteriota bacterium]